MLTLIEQFSPLLRKLSFSLCYNLEDAYNDILLAFIKLIRGHALAKMRSHNTGCIVRYIHISMLHEFYSLSDKQKRCLEEPITIPKQSGSSDVYSLYWDIICSQEDEIKWEQINYLQSYLTERELDIIVSIFFNRYLVKELALKFSVSSARISYLKNIALLKLRSAYMIE